MIGTNTAINGVRLALSFLLGRLQRVFLTARDLSTNITRSLKVSTCKTNMAARYDSTIERCVKNSLTQYSFYVMESRVSSNCTRNVHRLSTPEKEVNRKENTVGKISQISGRQIRKSALAQIPIVAKFYSIT